MATRNNDNPKPTLVWWLRLIYAIIGAILGLLGEAISGVTSAALNALF